MKFQHDCERCKPVGEVGPYDLYTCPDTHGHTTYIARFADEGGSYASMCDWPREVPIENFKGWRKVKLSLRESIAMECSGLSEQDLDIMTTFRLMPSLLLNMVKERVK